MDKTIINLLFNYKGTITYREFRVGIIILFMLTATYLGSLLNTSLFTLMVGRIGTEWLVTNSVYTQITSSFTPNLVPVWFIISFSSFVLALKRMRILKHIRAIEIASGIINYLFFASFNALIMLEMHQERGVPVTPTLNYIVYTFFVVGVVNLIYLYIGKGDEQDYSSYSKERLNISEYTIKLGNLIGITAILGIIISFILKLSDVISSFPTVMYIIIGLGSIISFILYIKYSIYRLKDADISVLWLIFIMTIYSIMYGLRIWLNLHFLNNLTLYYNTLFTIATSFFIAAQYILFLLPTKNKK